MDEEERPNLNIMLVHLRLTVPDDLAAPVADLLVDHAHVTNVIRVPGASLVPNGDLIECDVAREATSQVLTELGELDLPERGGIVVLTPTSTPFAEASRLERGAPGDPEDAVIWQAVRASAEQASRPTITFHIFLVLATILAAIAVVTDSAVLVVGAMVVGPEFSAVAAICTGLVFGQFTLALRAARLLVLSFAFAIAVVTVLGVVAAATGLITADIVSRPRPQTGFIWHPDEWSFIVAVVAGAAGVLALSTEKSAAMVGVFISVTTVPAAGNLALALATWHVGEMTGSLTQLGLNFAGMIVAGVIVLALQRAVWHPLTARSDQLFGIRR